MNGLKNSCLCQISPSSQKSILPSVPYYKGALDLTTSTRLSTITTFDFQINDVSRALVPHVGFRQRG